MLPKSCRPRSSPLLGDLGVHPLASPLDPIHRVPRRLLMSGGCIRAVRDDSAEATDSILRRELLPSLMSGKDPLELPNLSRVRQLPCSKQHHAFEHVIPPGCFVLCRFDFLPDAYERRSEERRVGKECRSRWSPY